jgi:hypothetical protein
MYKTLSAESGTGRGDQQRRKRREEKASNNKLHHISA